jgi:hypothetical protein
LLRNTEVEPVFQWHEVCRHRRRPQRRPCRKELVEFVLRDELLAEPGDRDGVVSGEIAGLEHHRPAGGERRPRRVVDGAAEMSSRSSASPAQMFGRS